MTYESTKVQYLDESSSDDCDNDNAASTSPLDALGSDEPCRDDCGDRSGDLVAATVALQLKEQKNDQQSSREPESRLVGLLREKSDTEERLSHVLRDIAELDESTQPVLASSAEDVASAISAARAINGVGVLQSLKRRGKQLDCRNQDGRTPIMEAALWGCMANVVYLLKQGVDYLGCDAKGMRARDLAGDTESNRNERAERRGKIFKEIPVDAICRKEIQVLLNQPQPPALEITHRSSASELVGFFDRTPDGRLAYYQPQCLLKVPPKLAEYYPDKAFGMLDRGPTHPMVFAMSGFSHSDWPDVLDNKATTSIAERLRTVLGLPPDKEAASHVEAQLLAYLVHTHWPYMLDDRDDLQVQADTIPSYDIHPLITVSKPHLCPKCSELFGYFQDKFPSMDIVFHCVGDSYAAEAKLTMSEYSCGYLDGRRS